jgi:uncharacterized protein YkwD
LTRYRTVIAGLGMLALLPGCAGGPSGEAYNGPTSLPEIRAASGLGPLRADSELERAAAVQAQNMARANAMNHTTAGGTFAVRMTKVSTNGGAAENIAHGAFGTDELFRRWMESPPHRRNMLNPTFTRFGLASAADPKGGGRRYWALVLAR